MAATCLACSAGRQRNCCRRRRCSRWLLGARHWAGFYRSANGLCRSHDLPAPIQYGWPSTRHADRSHDAAMEAADRCCDPEHAEERLLHCGAVALTLHLLKMSKKLSSIDDCVASYGTERPAQVPVSVFSRRMSQQHLAHRGAMSSPSTPSARRERRFIPAWQAVQMQHPVAIPHR